MRKSIEPDGVDGDLEPHSHEVTVGLERSHSRVNSLSGHVLFVHPSAGRMTEAEDTGGATALGASEAALPVVNAYCGRDHRTSVVTGLTACASHSSERD